MAYSNKGYIFSVMAVTLALTLTQISGLAVVLQKMEPYCFSVKV